MIRSNIFHSGRTYNISRYRYGDTYYKVDVHDAWLVDETKKTPLCYVKKKKSGSRLYHVINSKNQRFGR